MNKNALIIGNSDGIGMGLTKALLNQGWRITGLSRSVAKIKHPSYQHHILEVQSDTYLPVLERVVETIGIIDLCVYCPGIGELLDVTNMGAEIEIFEVNLLGMVKTASVVIPRMVSQGHGHFIGLSSMADEMLSEEAPSYHASKAGFSNYLVGLGLALKSRGVSVTNVRFGFVDTKMAKGDVKPFMMSVEDAVRHLMKCIEGKPVRYTAPRMMLPLVKFRRWMLGFRLK